MINYFDMMKELSISMQKGLEISNSFMCKKCHILPIESYGDELEKHGLCSRCFQMAMENGEFDDKRPYGDDA